MLSCTHTHTHTENDLLTTLVTEKSWFPLMSESCTQHNILVQPTLQIDIKSVLDYMLWPMSQSIKGLKFLYFCSHYFSTYIYHTIRYISILTTTFLFLFPPADHDTKINKKKSTTMKNISILEMHFLLNPCFLAVH